MNNDLTNKLLSIESGEIVDGIDATEEIKDLLERGKEFRDDHPTKKKGEPNQCHRNVSIFYANTLKKLKKSNWKIVTGYAISDGKWVAHSWLLNTTYNSISETVKIKFQAYYGYVLTCEESEKFCDNEGVIM